MPRTKEVELVGTYTIEADSNTTRKVTTAFYAEREAFQDEVVKLAKKAGQTTIEFYTATLLDGAIEARFEFAMSKREKVLKGAIGVLVAMGKTEDEARMALGLGVE